MGIIAKAGSTREPIDAGMYVARCYSIIDIGTVEDTWEGKVKQVHKVRIGFELPHEMKVYEEGKPAQPTVFFIPRNLSLGKKSRMRPELESWRGKAFTDEEAKGFDITKLLGAPCMLNIIHNEDGYERVHAITPVPKGMEVPPQINPTALLSYEDWNQELYDRQPDFIKEQMETTPEYAGLTKGVMAKQTIPPHADPNIQADPPKVETVVAEVVEDEADDLPF